MADDSVVVGDDDSKIVTEFFLRTIRPLQPSRQHAQAAALYFEVVTAVHPRDDYDALVGAHTDNEINVPLVTGSSAEFQIQPMLSCVGDIDVMFHRSDELAMPQGYPPPTELPAEFYSRVRLYEIVDSDCSGYVYLVLSYLLIEDSDAGGYNAVAVDNSHCVCFVSHGCFPKNATTACETNGPAWTISDVGLLPYDAVYCIRCLSWPSQAADWSIRPRKYGWPDLATVDRVVSNGCDVVGVAHRDCRHSKWKNEHQHRLSFSRAEIVLLNSWMPVQQIVYHMLRVFVKRGGLTNVTDNTETKIFSNYHIKTLMLWACELKPQSWWISDVNVVRTSASMLHNLADCLKNRVCRHYFVNDCNLVYSTVHSELLTVQLMSITESYLSTWFVNNYLRKCAHLCPKRVSRLFEDVSTRTKLQNAVSAVVDWRPNNALCDLWHVLGLAAYFVSMSVSRNSLTVRSCDYWITELAKIDSCLHHYITAVALLHIANRVAKRSLTNELLDVLATLVGQFVGKRRHFHQLSSEQSLSQAALLMKVAANNSSSSTKQLIEIELAEAYLYRALRCKDSDSDSIYCLADAYLAALHYTSGRYRMAIYHCTLVMTSQDHSQCSSHVVHGDLLPKIDDDTDTALGLAVLYQNVRAAALNQQQARVAIFSVELFACILYTRSVSVVKLATSPSRQMPPAVEIQRYANDAVDKDQLFIADLLLIKTKQMLPELTCLYKPLSDQRKKITVKAELVELLQQSAVEHLTTFRQFEARRYGSVATIATTDFEALYAYKHGDYQRCLQLSTHNVRRLLYYMRAPSVSAFPEFIQLMDDDITSLSALIHICRVVSPVFRVQPSSVISNHLLITQLTLSLYLMTQCQLKLRHSVTSLIQTLDYIEFAHRRCPPDWTFDHLTLKLTERKITIRLSEIKQH